MKCLNNINLLIFIKYTVSIVNADFFNKQAISKSSFMLRHYYLEQLKKLIFLFELYIEVTSKRDMVHMNSALANAPIMANIKSKFSIILISLSCLHYLG